MEIGYSHKAIELYQNQVNDAVIDYSDADAVSLGPSGTLIRLYIRIKMTITKETTLL